MRELLEAASRRYAAALEQVGQPADAPDPVSRLYSETLHEPADVAVAASLLFSTPEQLRRVLPRTALDVVEPLDDTGVSSRQYRDAYPELTCILLAESQNRPVGCR